MDSSVPPASSSAGPVRRTRNRNLQSQRRASRKANHDDIMLDRISSLLPFSKRIMDQYAGNVLAGRLQTLETLEEYQRHHNEDPIAERAKSQWECRICSRCFISFQKVSIHITSHEWHLRSWYCLEIGCQRRYGSSIGLTRHKKDPHTASNNISAAAVDPTTTLTVPAAVHSSESPQIAMGPSPSAEMMPFHRLIDQSRTAYRNRASPLPEHSEVYLDQQQLYMRRPDRREPAETTIPSDRYSDPSTPIEIDPKLLTWGNADQSWSPYAIEPHVELLPNPVASTSQRLQYRGPQVASISQQDRTGPIGVPHLSPTHRYSHRLDNLSVPDIQYVSLHDPTSSMLNYLEPLGRASTSRQASGSGDHGWRYDARSRDRLSNSLIESQATAPVIFDTNTGEENITNLAEEESLPQTSSPLFAILDTEGGHPSKIQSGGRIVRLVILGSPPLEESHRVWIHQQATFKSVREELSKSYPMGVTGSFVILKADWGPEPRWNEADGNSHIGDNCQVLYVVLKRQTVPYILAVVRDPLVDFPICVPITTGDSMTTSKIITTYHPELGERISSITGYGSHKDVGGDPLDRRRVEALSSRLLRSSIIITLDKPSEKFMNEIPYKPTPALLQIPFLYCDRLMQRAYALEIFALQMIHLSSATRHLIICLANEMKTAFADQPSGVDAVLAAKGELADLLQVAPLLSHQLKSILDRIGQVMNQLEGKSFNGEQTEEIDAIFDSLCGEFPGAVNVRHSYKRFKRLGVIDRQENQDLASQSATSPGSTLMSVENERRISPESNHGRDTDHEMVDIEAVRTPQARRRRTRHRMNPPRRIINT